MKIFFDNVNFSSRTGPNTFAFRLAKQLTLMGHVIADPDDYDVHLAVINATRKTLPGKVLVQRLDGIWFKPEEFATHNVEIKRTWDAASAVVWQSSFDRTMTEKHWGMHAGVVIRNGIDLTRQIREFRHPEIETLRSSYDHMFVCSASWHPQKRLRDNVALFRHLRKTLPGTSCLIVMGRGYEPYMVADHDVFYTGEVPEDVYLEFYSAANWMLHLAWLDHSPNVVCECLGQGTPVVCSSDGGTRELVGGFGVVLNESKKYDYALANYDDPPTIDVTQIDAFSLLKKPVGKHADIDIEHVAQQYISLFDSLLS